MAGDFYRLQTDKPPQSILVFLHSCTVFSSPCLCVSVVNRVFSSSLAGKLILNAFDRSLGGHFEALPRCRSLRRSAGCRARICRRGTDRCFVQYRRGVLRPGWNLSPCRGADRQRNVVWSCRHVPLARLAIRCHVRTTLPESPAETTRVSGGDRGGPIMGRIANGISRRGSGQRCDGIELQFVGPLRAG